jgi:hypothetical protein
LDASAIKTIIDASRKEIQKEQDEEKRLDYVQIQQEKKIYTDPRLLAAKEVLAWIFEKIPSVLNAMK